VVRKEKKRGHSKTQGNPNPLNKRLYTLREASEYLGRSVWGVRELVWSGKLPVVRDEGGRKIFLDLLDLEDFISKNKSVYR